MLRYAEIDWMEDATPVSRSFGDVYYSRGQQRAETEHVFVNGCGLPGAWQQAQYFTIAETGFGTGLNFLHTWQRFTDTAPPDAVLHFLSVEAFPLSLPDLKKALEGWDGPQAGQLIAQYPLPVPGWHRLRFGRIILTLGFGDASRLLEDYDASVDAWFLDGFSPSRNDTMWTETLFDAIARMSHEGTRIASFTAAGHVRRALAARGFAIERRDGFGHKRHAISGIYTPSVAASVPHMPSRAIVVGAGIAGCSMARALAERGTQVTVLEKHDGPAREGSGNPAAVLYPHITQHWGVNMAWHLAGFAHTLRMVKHAPYATLGGMLKTPKDAKDEARLRAICAQAEPDLVQWLEPQQAREYMGETPPAGGAWFATSGWLSPRAWCEDLLQHEAIMLRTGCNMESLMRAGTGWQVRCADGSRLDADHVILANAAAATHAAPLLHHAISPTAGQVSVVPAEDIARRPHAVFCHRGYLIPYAGNVVMGATYDHHDLSCDVTVDNHRRNAEEAEKALPGIIAAAADPQRWQGRTSLRAGTRDRLPLAGRIEEGLYISAGHGSRGMVSAPYAAELVASMICHEPLPVARSLAASLDPLRSLRKL